MYSLAVPMKDARMFPVLVMYCVLLQIVLQTGSQYMSAYKQVATRATTLRG